MTQQAEVNSGVLKDMSDEQLEALKKRVTKLLSDDSDLNLIATTMIASRQTYALARLVLSQALEERHYSWVDGVEEFIIKAMADKANQPFLREDLFRKLSSYVIQFVSDELRKEREEENRKLREELNAERNLQLKPIDIVYKCNNAVFELGPLNRGDVVLLFGSYGYIYAVMNEIKSNLIAANEQAERKNVILHLTPNYIYMPSVEEDPCAITRHSSNISKVLDLGPSKFARTMANMLTKAYKNRCDIILINDILVACGDLTGPRSPARQIEAAIKLIRKWASINNVVVIFGLPVEPENYFNIDYEELQRVLSPHMQMVCVDDQFSNASPASVC